MIDRFAQIRDRLVGCDPDVSNLAPPAFIPPSALLATKLSMPLNGRGHRILSGEGRAHRRVVRTSASRRRFEVDSSRHRRPVARPRHVQHANAQTSSCCGTAYVGNPDHAVVGSDHRASCQASFLWPIGPRIEDDTIPSYALAASAWFFSIPFQSTICRVLRFDYLAYSQCLKKVYCPRRSRPVNHATVLLDQVQPILPSPFARVFSAVHFFKRYPDEIESAEVWKEPGLQSLIGDQRAHFGDRRFPSDFVYFVIRLESRGIECPQNKIKQRKYLPTDVIIGFVCCCTHNLNSNILGSASYHVDTDNPQRRRFRREKSLQAA